MESREAYDLIRGTVEADRRGQIVKSFFDDRNFGNFFVSFEVDGEGRCIVNDRGFVSVADRVNGTGVAIATVPSLRDVDGPSLLEGLKL